MAEQRQLKGSSEQKDMKLRFFVQIKPINPVAGIYESADC